MSFLPKRLNFKISFHLFPIISPTDLESLSLLYLLQEGVIKQKALVAIFDMLKNVLVLLQTKCSSIASIVPRKRLCFDTLGLSPNA